LLPIVYQAGQAPTTHRRYGTGTKRKELIGNFGLTRFTGIGATPAASLPEIIDEKEDET
jgi:hypothetical protein